MSDQSPSAPHALEESACGVGPVLLSIIILLVAVGSVAISNAARAVAQIPSSCTAMTNGTVGEWPQPRGGESYLYNCYPGDSTAWNLMGTLQGIPSIKLKGENPENLGLFALGSVHVFVFHSWSDARASGIAMHSCGGTNTNHTPGCTAWSTAADLPGYWKYVFVVTNPDGVSYKPSWYDIKETTIHELGHMVDVLYYGKPQADSFPSVSDAFKSLVQHDLYFLDYITYADGTRTPRAPCNTDTPLNLAGPFQALTDPSTGYAFCVLSKSTPVHWVLANSKYQGWANSKILQQVYRSPGADWVEFAYLFNSQPDDPLWRELFGDEFYWASLRDVGNPPPYYTPGDQFAEPWNQAVRLFFDDNDPSFFTCSEAWLKNVWNGDAVPPNTYIELPPMCSSDIGTYEPFQDRPVEDR